MSEETRDGFLPLQPAELTLAREMLGLDNIGIGRQFLAKDSSVSQNFHLLDINIGIDEYSYMIVCSNTCMLLKYLTFEYVY